MLHDKIMADLGPDLRRREPRLGIIAELSLRPLGQNAVEARLVNLSSCGFMVETRALIEPGSRVWLTLPGAGRVNGLVIWALNGRIGGEFAEAIDPLAVFAEAGKTAR